MRRGRLDLTARGRVTLLLVHLTASAAWLTQQTFAQLATAALAAPLLVDLAWKLLAPPRISASVRARRTRAGDLFLERIRVENLGTRASVHALEVAEPAMSVRRGDAWLETLPAGTAAHVEIPARARRRGIAAERLFSAETQHPFGMLRWRVELPCPARVVSEPARVPLPREVVERLEAADREPQTTGVAHGSEFFALREYHPGDDARLVHAKRSASVGVLVARDARGGRDADATLVVDMRRPPGRGYHFGDRRAEIRLGLAATLLDELLARQAIPRCILIDDRLRAWHVDTPREAEAVLDAFAETRARRFRSVDSTEIERAIGAGTTFWVPAGGYDGSNALEHDTGVIVVREEAAP